MTDIHTHILPCIDDGSKSASESAEMLRLLSEQGVTTVCATPHFYPNVTDPARFLEQRGKSLQMLSDHLGSAPVPRIVPGAEVSYYEGITHLSCIRDLCIGDTGILLLEMPGVHWSERMLRDLRELTEDQGLTVVLAHIERFLTMQPRKLWAELHRSGILFQVNASFFIARRTQLLAVHMLKKGLIDLIGSDCHNTGRRPPELGSAYAVIEKRFGSAFTQTLIKAQDDLFAI